MSKPPKVIINALRGILNELPQNEVNVLLLNSMIKELAAIQAQLPLVDRVTNQFFQPTSPQDTGILNRDLFEPNLQHFERLSQLILTLHGVFTERHDTLAAQYHYPTCDDEEKLMQQLQSETSKIQKKVSQLNTLHNDLTIITQAQRTFGDRYEVVLGDDWENSVPDDDNNDGCSI